MLILIFVALDTRCKLSGYTKIITLFVEVKVEKGLETND